MDEHQNTLLKAWTPFVLSIIIPQELKHHTVTETKNRSNEESIFLFYHKIPQYS